MRKNRISEVISNINLKYVDEAAYAGYETVVRRPEWLKWAAAAYLILTVIFGVGIFGGRFFDGRERAAVLKNGDTIHFTKSDTAMQQSDIAFQVKTRDLTKDETAELFHGLPVTACAVFDAEDGSLAGLEGTVNNMKLIVSKADRLLRDIIVEGEENVSDVCGVSVCAGYSIMGADSKGKKTVIYYATFKSGDCMVYIEHSGPEEKEGVLRNEIASAVYGMISLGGMDLSGITDN